MTTASRLVVDASVAVKWLLPEDDSDRAHAILTAAQRGETQLLAPDVFLPEIANVLWVRSQLRGDLSADRARQALATLAVLSPTIVPSRGLVAQALELAFTFRHAVYDCLYVALAIRSGCPVITADRRLIRAFGPATASVVDLTEFEPAS